MSDVFPNGSEPRHPRMKIYQDRLKTFHDYDKKSPLSKEVLCKAGFFFLGNGDNVQCFNCGMKLRNWRASDDPFEGHAKISPKCPFVLKEKGEEFVNRVVAGNSVSIGK